MYALEQASDGLLGFDAKTKIQTLPIALLGMAKLQTAQVACGENHVLLLTTGGLVYSFGNGESGQLGRYVHDAYMCNDSLLTPQSLYTVTAVLVGD